MKCASSATDTKSDALSRMLSSIRPHIVMLTAFSATCARAEPARISGCSLKSAPAPARVPYPGCSLPNALSMSPHVVMLTAFGAACAFGQQAKIGSRPSAALCINRGIKYT